MTNLNGQIIRVECTAYIALNLTPGGELGFCSEADFYTTMRTGVKPSGRELNVFMTWKYFGKMTDEEVSAVWIYLQSLPELEQAD